MAPLAEAEVALAHADFERARAMAAEAEAMVRADGARRFLPSSLDLQARACMGLGERQEARERWKAARDEAERLKARIRLWPILLALSRLEEDPGEAERLRQEARDVMTYIAERTPRALRDSFLSSLAEGAAFPHDRKRPRDDAHKGDDPDERQGEVDHPYHAERPDD